MSNAAFKELLTRYLNDTISVEELHELLHYLQKHENPAVVKQAIEQALLNNTFRERADKSRTDMVFEKIMQQAKIAAPDSYRDADETTGTTKEPRSIMPWLKWAAAAAVVIMAAGAGYYFLWQKEPAKTTGTAQTKQTPAGDRAPGGNKAFLQLADGSIITLDDAATGMLAQQGNTKIVKLNNGRLQYNSSAPGNAPVLYNTISTPRGGQYHVVLPDGSNVWLNAASSLRFPTTFQGNQRMVQLTGEAYFEVAPSISPGRAFGKPSASEGGGGKKIPFLVDILPSTGGVGRGRVEVLGTHFNIMSYENEKSINTTLLEGSVRFSVTAAGQQQSTILKPGEQASISHSSQTSHFIPVQTVDTEAVIAWKNGIFQFNSADIQTIMRQIERWYDVEVIYKGPIPQGHYSGIVRRDNNLLKVLRIFEESDLKFTIEGKKLNVL